MKIFATVFFLGLFLILLNSLGVISLPLHIGLNAVVSDSLKGTKGEYAVAIKNLKTSEAYLLNADKEFEAGSLYKLWVMAEVFRQIEAGKLKGNEVLTQEIATLNEKFDIGKEAELTKGKISLTVSQALSQMITISHNYAALLLSERVKNSSVSRFLDDNGFRNSKLGDDKSGPTTTAKDMELFFEKLYKGELADRKNTEKMLTLLKNQKLNEKLPKYLPEEVQIAHKTGEIDYFSHDAGIVFGPKSDYIIVVLSSSSNPLGASERIALLSKAVYSYFQRNLTSF